MSKNKSVPAQIIDESFKQKAFVVCRIVIFAVCALITVFLLVSSYQTMRLQLTYDLIITALNYPFMAKGNI